MHVHYFFWAQEHMQEGTRVHMRDAVLCLQLYWLDTIFQPRHGHHMQTFLCLLSSKTSSPFILVHAVAPSLQTSLGDPFSSISYALIVGLTGCFISDTLGATSTSNSSSSSWPKHWCKLWLSSSRGTLCCALGQLLQAEAHVPPIQKLEAEVQQRCVLTHVLLL